MSQFFLINRVKIATTGGVHTYSPGALIDDAQDPVSSIQAAGGVLYPSTDATIAAAALIAQALVARGQYQDAAFTMAAAAAQSSTSDGSSLTTRISTEESTRSVAAASLTTRLSTEESTRSTADASLTTRLSTAESAATSLQTRLSTEESTRASQTASLTTRISLAESVEASVG